MTPTLSRVREILVEKFGKLTCRHKYTLVVEVGGMRLRCAECGHLTEVFRVAGSVKP